MLCLLLTLKDNLKLTNMVQILTEYGKEKLASLFIYSEKWINEY